MDLGADDDVKRAPLKHGEYVEYPWVLACYDLAYVYSVEKVLAGTFDEKIIAIPPDFIVWDETFSPFVRRIAVGRVEQPDPAVSHSGFLLVPGQIYIEAPVLRARLPEQKKPSPAESASRLAELATFGPSHLGLQAVATSRNKKVQD